MAGILKRKKRLGRPRKSVKKDVRSKKSDSKNKIKSTKAQSKTKESKTSKVGSDESSQPKVTKSKRGPGRPRKTKKKQVENIADDDKHKTTILEKQEPPKKRGPGRPPKSKNKKSAEEDKPKRKPGRPKKSESSSTTTKKGKPGRPKKSDKASSKTSTSTAKRGPGRPRKKKGSDEEETSKKSSDSKKQPNPLLEIMDNFRDDISDDGDSSTPDELKDFMVDSMGADVMGSDDDIELMSNSDLDVEEIIKIDTTDSDEIERELDELNGISEKEQMKEDVAEMEKRETICPECGSTKLINDHERGEVVCASCGLVIDDNIVDMGPEWRAFDHEQRDKRTRVGAPITYTIHDKGLSTMIDWRNKDIYGRDIPARNRAQWYRLRKWQRKIRISGATERNLAFALSELDRDSSRLGLPRSVRESASVVYRNAVENKLIRGRSIEGVVAASLYAACRRCKVPRTLDEIADVSRVSKKEVGRTYRFLTRELHIRLPPTSPIDYVPRFASELNLSGVVQSKAIEIINQAMDNGLTSGRGPTGVAAAALYIASVILGERKTQRDVADIAGVTEVTIRNRYKELTEQLDMGVKL